MTMLSRYELPDLIDKNVENAFLYARTIIPAAVTAVHTDKNMVDVRFKSRKRTAVVDVRDVPIVYFSTQNFCVVSSPVVGDTCLLLISDRDIDAIKYGTDADVKLRYYDVTDALALIGFSPVTQAIGDVNADRIQVRTRGGDCAVDVYADKIEGVVEGGVVTKTTSDRLRVNGNLHVTIDTRIEGDTQVDGDTRINGDLRVNGSITVAGSIICGSNVDVSGVVTASGFVDR